MKYQVKRYHEKVPVKESREWKRDKDAPEDELANQNVSHLAHED